MQAGIVVGPRTWSYTNDVLMRKLCAYILKLPVVPPLFKCMYGMYVCMYVWLYVRYVWLYVYKDCTTCIYYQVVK